MHALGQEELMRKVVVDDPFVPRQLQPVPIGADPRKKPFGVAPRRRGVERQPAIAREIDLHPGVRVTRAHNVVAPDIVVLTRKEAVHHSCGTPRVRSITVMAEAKYSQWPDRVTKRNLASASPSGFPVRSSV